MKVKNDDRFLIFGELSQGSMFSRFSKSDKYFSAPLRTSDKWLSQQITFEAHDNKVFEYQAN